MKSRSFLLVMGLILLGLAACANTQCGPRDLDHHHHPAPCLDADGDGFCASDDCDDNNAAVNPAAVEVCNLVDDNCDGQIDEGVKQTFYADTDADSYGTLTGTTLACIVPSGYANTSDDCDDNNGAVNPGAVEVCDGFVDNDCNALTKATCFTTIYSLDEYDGWWKGHSDRVIMSIDLADDEGINELIHTLTYFSFSADSVYTYGLITFDLSIVKNTHNIIQAQIGIFPTVTWFYPSAASITAILSELLVPQEDYAGWETCNHYTDVSGTWYWVPEGCQMPAHNYETSDQSFALTPAENGYWNTEAAQLPVFLNSRKGSLVTFELVQKAFDDQGQQTMIETWWQDGGSHGGKTLDEPYLEITYEE